MSDTSHDSSQSIDDLLKMSMVPLPCQESQLNAKGSTITESICWLLDMKDKTPIWSRLNDINSSGFKRKLPMSMTKNYDIEINGRLWSLWGHKRQQHRTSSKASKSYMAITITALCAARVIRLNLWTTSLMDCIRDNGRQYYKSSLKKFQRCKTDFRLSDLQPQCSLEGVRFAISLKAVAQGKLYNISNKDPTNLATALTNFFNCHQFGILECCNRVLGLGLIAGPKPGYFMYDAQSSNYPLFAKHLSAPYLLRTNHLQILLYCVIVSLNVQHTQAPFKLHHVSIRLGQPKQSKTDYKTVKGPAKKCPRIIPSKCWKTPSIFSIKQQSSKTSSNLLLGKASNRTFTKQAESKMRTKTLYRRKLHNITKEKVERSLIKPLVDPDRKSDEDLQIKNDFVRMICSDTVLPMMATDLPPGLENDFTCDLLDALVMGPNACIIFKDL